MVCFPKDEADQTSQLQVVLRTAGDKEAGIRSTPYNFSLADPTSTRTGCSSLPISGLRHTALIGVPSNLPERP